MNVKWMSSREYIEIVAKMKLRRGFPGRNEFVLRPHLPDDKEMLVDIAAIDDPFTARVHLRAGSSDLANLQQVFMDGDYNLAALANYDRIKSIYAGLRAPLILDLGANVGLSALYFAKNWPKAKIVAIEPATDNIAAALHNTIGFSSIELRQAAVASRDGMVEIVNPADEQWAYQTKISDTGAIPARSIPSILAEHPGEQPFICKIDIEGAEVDLFSQNTEWMHQFPVIAIELHDWLFPGTAPTWNFLKALLAGTPKDVMMINQNLVIV